MNLKEFMTQGAAHYNELPDALKKSVDLANKATKNGTNMDMYKSSSSIKNMLDLASEKLNAFLNQHKSKQTDLKKTVPTEPTVSKKKPLPNKAVSKKIPKPKTTQIVVTHFVEELPIDIQIIKRFVLMVGKAKTANQIMSLLDFIQKAIVTKKVRKTSEYASEINYIQKTLIGTYQEMSKNGTVTLEFSNSAEENKYMAMVNDFARIKSVALIKQYINLDGSKQTPDKAKALWTKMNRFVNLEENEHDKYIDVLKQLKTQLHRYYSGEIDNLKINSVALSGIMPVLTRYGYKAIKYGDRSIHEGYQLAKPIARHVIKTNHNHKEHLSGVNNDSDVMSVGDAKLSNFELIGFTGDFFKLIGKACEPTSIFIYGNGGSGKSGLSLKLADDLNKKHKSVMYVAGEQFNTPTFTELLRKVNITGSDTFKIVRNLNSLPITDYKVIVIDSKDSVGLTRSADFKELRNTHPDKIWIITSQGTKAGDFTGDEKWRNEVDTLIYCERGVASTINEKNRWGGKAEIKLF